MVLTRREREIAGLVANGLTNRAIAQRLFLSERTVEGHIEHAFAKLGISSRTQLAMWIGAAGKSNASTPLGSTTFPAQLTTFVGREKDMAALRAMVVDHRLVTLIGPGGSGKTRLALELVRALRDADKTEVWLVDLSAIADSALVAQVAAAAIGATAAESPADAIVERLRGSRGILVLDNCEHVASAAADLASRILADCPEVTVLATSREPLRLAGEMTWRVEALAVPSQESSPKELAGIESVRLFADRARLSLPGFQIDDLNMTAVAEICRRLDGLPLAIELAAARVAVLSTSQIAERLDDRFNLLVSGSRSLVARHQTLKTTLEWSYGLLPAMERRLFSRLSVFAGTFNLDAVEAVCGVEPLESAQLVQLLGLLIDKSLVAVTGEMRGELRYRLLDSMRAFGREMLMAEPDADDIVERHARLYASMALEAGKRLGGPDASDWISLVGEEIDNLRAALVWAIEKDIELALRVCASLSGYWDLRAWLYEGRHWLSRALEQENGTPSAERGAALAAAGQLAYRQSDFAEAHRRFEETLRVAEAIGDSSLSARALAGLGDVHIVLSQPNDALRCYQLSLEIYRAENDLPSVARGLSRLGNAYDNLADYETEERMYLESLALFRQLDDRVGIGDQLFSIGMGRFISGKFESALPYLFESLAVRRELGDALGVAWSQMGIGYIEIRLGDPKAAREPLIGALIGCDDAGDVRGVAFALDFVVGFLLQVGKPGVAVRLGSTAAELRRAIGFGQMPMAPVIDGWLSDAQVQVGPGEAEREQMLGTGLTRKAAIEVALEHLRSISTPSETNTLTARERQVVALVAEGLTNREIAQRLSISQRTADSHVQHTIDKLGFRSRAQLAAWHVRNQPRGAAVERGTTKH